MDFPDLRGIKSYRCIDFLLCTTSGNASDNDQVITLFTDDISFEFATRIVDPCFIKSLA